ncbi:MAG: Qat anti-phage system QueC-like protein QatC [Candidatus Thiodiazotropha endolucinida]
MIRRHSIVARLGPADTSTVTIYEPRSVTTEIRFIDGEKRLSHGLGQIIDELAKRGLYPTEDAVDLAILAGTVTAADTRINRESESQDSWTREIDLYVPVSTPKRWNAIAPLAERMLHFLTGDRWRLFFRARNNAYKKIIETSQLAVGSQFSSVCLFSGGLDSFTGAVDLLAGGENPIFVSHYWDASTSSQLPCASTLGKQYGDLDPRHVRARVGFPDNLVSGSDPENTLRARSFLFFSLAALAASCLNGKSTIYVPENGLISLNVPLDPLRLGAWSTRTTHPFYMARWQELFDALGFPFTLENPYRFKTKGEMLSQCKNKGFLKKHAHETISCSSYTKARFKKLPLGHCGYCVPCLIRRASIETAFGHDRTDYKIVPDLTAHTLDASKAEGEGVQSFQMMVSRLERKPSIARLLIHKSGPLSDYTDSEIDAYADVFRRGIAEVGKLVEHVKVKPL